MPQPNASPAPADAGGLEPMLWDGVEEHLALSLILTDSSGPMGMPLPRHPPHHHLRRHHRKSHHPVKRLGRNFKRREK